MTVKTKLNKDKVFQLLQDHAEEVREFGVSRLGLFGSMVRDEATNESDIDILVEFKEGQKNYDNFIHLVYFLEDLLQRDVDLVTRKAIADWMLPHIDKQIEYVEYDG
jgi:predicted nucleotidyltransferase